MIVYFTLPVITFLFYLVTLSRRIGKSISVFLYILIFFILSLIAGYRGETVSRDYQNYIRFFYQIIAGNYVPAVNDPGFSAISLFVAYFSNSYIYMFLVYALLGVFLKLISFKRILGTSGAFLAVIVYLSNFYFLHEMTQIRIGVATGFFLLGIPYIIKREFAKYLICVLLATFFHLSAFIVFPLYFLNTKKIYPAFWIGLLSINAIFFIFHLSIMDFVQHMTPAFLSDKIVVAKEYMMSSYGFTNIRFFNRFLLYLILNLFLLFNWKLLSSKSEYFVLLLKASFISLSIAFFLYDFFLFAYRFSEIIGVVQICLFAMLTYVFTDRLSGSIVVLSLSLFLILVNIVFTGLLTPYHFIAF